MKKIILPAIIITMVITHTSFLFMINDINISIRLNELKMYLQSLDRIERNIDHISLIATYESHKKMYENNLSQEKADALEQKIDTLITSSNNISFSPERYSIISTPAVWMINVNRKILGKEPLQRDWERRQDLLDLDVAYYYERNFMFKHAISMYEKALLKKNISSNIRTSILLHQGYCYAMAGLNDRARNNYSIIINNYSQESIAMTATVLSMYLEGFKTAREVVLKSKENPLLQSQKLVTLLGYEQALDILETSEKSADPQKIAFIKYYKARCYAGLGKLDKAAETYVNVITKYPSSDYAKFSNRKLFMIGARAGGDNYIQKISIQFNNRLKDPILSSMIEDSKTTSDTGRKINILNELDLSEAVQKEAEKFSSNKIKHAENAEYFIIETKDGNTFKGTVIEKTDIHIALQTSIGRIDVKKDKIVKITVKK